MKKKLKKIYRKKYFKIFLILSVVIFAVAFESLLIMLRYERINKIKQNKIGVSFSQIQAERYGVDWKANYSAILDDLNFKKLRIPAYWNRIEPEKGTFDFSETDWMVNEASKRNVSLTIVVGQKNIRYPECFYPNWVDTKNTTETSKDAIRYIEKVVERYKNSKAVVEWQLENEFLLKSFGNCPSNLLTNKQLKNELVALKKIDPFRPIVLTQSDQFGFPLAGPFGDRFGISMYRWSWNKEIGYWRYPQNGAYFWWKAALINLIFGQDIKIHELQAEAWGPKGNEFLEYEETLKSMTPEQLDDNFKYARETKIHDIDLWGAEWWWHMKLQGHPEIWQKIKDLVKTQSSV